MTDPGKSREQLLEEIAQLRRRLARHEAALDESWGGAGPAKPGGSIWQSLVANTPIFILVLDREGRIRFVNRTDSGVPADRLLGMSLYDFSREEFRPTIRAGIEEVFRTGKPGLCEGPAWRLDDQEHWYAAYIGPIYRHGELVAVSVISINITERKRAEERLRESEEALRTTHDELEIRVRQRTEELAKANEALDIFRKFAEASAEGFRISDFEGRIVYANPALCRLLGETSPESMIGQSIAAHYPDGYMLVWTTKRVPALLADGFWEGEQDLVRSDGTRVPTWHSGFLIRDERGEPFRSAVVFHDITERKQAQAALEKERRTLEHLFRASDHERQLIAYEIHDELAQVLAGAIMLFESFEHAMGIDRDEARRLYADAMIMLRRGVAETRRLISGVRPPILDEAGVVEAVNHLVHQRWEPPDLNIEFHSDVAFHRLVPIQENSIYRIVQEALTNAVKYSQSATIRVELVQQRDRLRIRVQDWGVGFHVDRQSEGRFGLAGIRDRARLLGGSAVIESTPGRGTTVLVEMPLVESLG